MIHHLLNILNKNEQKSIYNFITRSNTNELTRDIYAHIRMWHEEEQICKKLNISENLFRRMKSALSKEVIKGISVLYFEFDTITEGLYLLVLGITLKLKGHPELTEKLLVAAEKKLENAHSSIQYFLYSEWINLYTEHIYKDPTTLINKRAEVVKLLTAETSIDAQSAQLIFAIKKSQHFSQRKDLIKKLEKTLRNVNTLPIKNVPSLRLKLYESLSRILQQKNEFQLLIEITEKTLREFEKKSWFQRHNHETKLKLFINLINSLFMVGKLAQALTYLHRFNEELHAYKSLHYKKYCFFYYNGLVMIYSQENKEMAVQTLQQALNDKAFTDNVANTFFAYLNLSLQYFDMKNFRQAVSAFVSCTNHEHFKKIDEAFQLKLITYELILRYHLKDDEYCESLIRKIMRTAGSFKDETAIVNDMLICKFINNKLRGKETDTERLLHELQLNNTRFTTKDLINYTEWISSL